MGGVALCVGRMLLRVFYIFIVFGNSICPVLDRVEWWKLLA
jgi:hypothetical protein